MDCNFEALLLLTPATRKGFPRSAFLFERGLGIFLQRIRRRFVNCESWWGLRRQFLRTDGWALLRAGICEIVWLIASEHFYNITNLGLNIHSDMLCDIARKR